MSKNIYEQQIHDFLCRAKGRVGELTAEEGNCGCHRELLGDLALAIDTLSDCHSPLSVAQQLQIVGILTSRANLRCAQSTDASCGVIVREGASCGCSHNASGAALSLPLTGEQVTVRVDGHTRQLQSVITEIYNRTASIYLVDGGIPSSIYHPSTQRA